MSLDDAEILAGYDEAFQERAAIREFDGGQTREEMHAAEVRDCIARYWPDGRRLADYLGLVEKRRGKESADKLRADCREAWRAKQRGEE